jgi:hypothetical protein
MRDPQVLDILVEYCPKALSKYALSLFDAFLFWGNHQKALACIRSDISTDRYEFLRVLRSYLFYRPPEPLIDFFWNVFTECYCRLDGPKWDLSSLRDWVNVWLNTPQIKKPDAAILRWPYVAYHDQNLNTIVSRLVELLPSKAFSQQTIPFNPRAGNAWAYFLLQHHGAVPYKNAIATIEDRRELRQQTARFRKTLRDRQISLGLLLAQVYTNQR